MLRREGPDPSAGTARGSGGVNQDILSGQLNELISILARSHQLWVTLGGQEPAQLPESLLQTMLTASALLVGQTRDPDMAKYLASRFYRYDPHLVRKREPVGGVIENTAPGGFLRPVLPTIHGITHYRTTEYSIEEQINLNSEVFLTPQRFHFLAGLAEREGELPTTLAPVTIAHMDAGLFVDKEKTTRLRAKLTARDGTPEEAVHREIAARRDRCVCLARPAFHDLVHRSQAAWDGTAPGVHPVGPGQPLPGGQHRTLSRAEHRSGRQARNRLLPQQERPVSSTPGRRHLRRDGTRPRRNRR